MKNNVLWILSRALSLTVPFDDLRSRSGSLLSCSSSASHPRIFSCAFHNDSASFWKFGSYQYRWWMLDGWRSPWCLALAHEHVKPNPCHPVEASFLPGWTTFPFACFRPQDFYGASLASDPSLAADVLHESKLWIKVWVVTSFKRFLFRLTFVVAAEIEDWTSPFRNQPTSFIAIFFRFSGMLVKIHDSLSDSRLF